LLKRLASISPFFLIVIVLTISQAHAEEPDVDIVYIPQQLSDHLNIPLFASEILVSLLVMVSIALPLSLLRAKGLLILIIFFPLMGFLIALGFLPVWIFLLVSLLVGLMYADKIKRLM